MTTITRSWALILCLVATPLRAQTPIDTWTLHADPAAANGPYYGETVANGMIGMISTPEPFQVKEVVLNGVFDTYRPGEVSTILKTFNLASMSLAIDAMEIVSADQVTGFHQSLDLRHAKLVHTFEVGTRASVRYMWYALRQAPYTALIDVAITAKQPITITPATIVDAPAELKEVTSAFHPDGAEGKLDFIVAGAKSPSGELVIGATHAFIFDEPREQAPRVTEGRTEGDEPTLTFTKSVAAGTTYRFAIVASTISSVQTADPYNDAARLTIFSALQGRERLIARHDRAWDELWQSDIIVAGNDTIQRDVRAMLYHLYAFARAGTAYSMSPMGLSGSGYLGHAFWDTELWMFPVLAVLQPKIAESLLEYRYQRLDGAQRNALAHGYEGAMFPWESAASGDEETPICCLTGEFEHHITGDVGVAAWSYYQITQDRRWLQVRGWPMLEGTARFWASRVERNGAGRYDINNVVGADEFAANVDNNAFTNGVARANLRAAIAAAEVLGVSADPDWQDVHDNIPILRFPDGVTREHSTYAGDTIKQADVNLLAYPLNEVTDPAAIERDLEYYLPRVARGPAMTYSIFSILYQRLGKTDTAYEMFLRGYRPNVLPPFGVLAEVAGGTNPYFATGAGGVLQAMLFGFGGLRITPMGITQDATTLPVGWTSLTITGVGPEERTYGVTREGA
ncbi:MAG: glycoside hydrolase family 65 protein [Longimicrobiales bacterium]